MRKMYVCETEFYVDVKAECIRVYVRVKKNMYLKGHRKRASLTAFQCTVSEK